MTSAGTLDIAFMRNLGNSVLLSTCAVVLALVLGVPAAYAFARFKFRLSEDIAFTLVVVPLRSTAVGPAAAVAVFQDLGLVDTYVGLIWVYQLIALPLILWIVRGYFEDISTPTRNAYRRGPFLDQHIFKIAVPLAGPGIAAAGLLSFIFCWNNFVFALHPCFGRQAIGYGRRAGLRDWPPESSTARWPRQSFCP